MSSAIAPKAGGNMSFTDAMSAAWIKTSASLSENDCCAQSCRCGSAVTFATIFAFFTDVLSKRTMLPSSSLSDSTRCMAGERLREAVLFRDSRYVELLESDCGVSEPSAGRCWGRFDAGRGWACVRGTVFLSEAGGVGAATFSILIVGAFRGFLPQKDMSIHESVDTSFLAVEQYASNITNKE